MADFIKLSFLVKAFVEIFEGAAFKNSFFFFAFIIDTASELLFFYHFQTFISQWNFFFILSEILWIRGLDQGVYTTLFQRLSDVRNIQHEGTESDFPSGRALGSIHNASNTDLLL